MTDSIAVLSVTDRVTDANGVPVSGAKLKFYEAGTTTPRLVCSDNELTLALGATVYCDSGGFPVTAEGGTTKTAIYTGRSDYKVIITDADDVTLITIDNLPGALNTAPFSGDGAVEQSVPVVAKSASYTIVADDNGTLFDFTTTGADCVATLPSAVTVGDGFYVGLRHNGTANELIIETVSSQTIGHTGAATDALSLTGLGEAVWLASNGANWKAYSYAPALIHRAPGVITIVDRLSAPPVSPAAGARYLLTSAPSGAWSSFAEHDIVESDGSSSWIKRTPPTDSGWLAYVQDEDQLYQRIGSAWTALSVIPAGLTAMETGTSTSVSVTPGVQKYHPLHPKAWASVDTIGTIAIEASSGVGSITDVGTGRLRVTWSTAFSSANYVAVATPVVANDYVSNISEQLAASVEISTYQIFDQALSDPTLVNVVAFGDI